MLHRRDLYRLGTFVMGGAMGLLLAVPGAAYVLDPLRRKSRAGVTQELARLSALPVGEPRAFAILDEREDAWVKYPREPIGSVWLVRQADGQAPAVLAFTAECPHLGCAVQATPDKGSFACPCHDARFDLTGRPLNGVAPRGMDTLTVELSRDDDPRVLVRFERFRAQTKEKTPLV